MTRRRAISGRHYPWGADEGMKPGQRQPHAPVAPQSARLWNHNAAAVEDPGRGLHSFTFQLNLRGLYGIGGARRGCVAHVKGVLGSV